MVLEVEGVERGLWLHETALKNKIRELRPEPGELLRVSKGEQKKTSDASGYSYWPIKVACPERPPSELDWDDALFTDAVVPVKAPVSDIPSTFEAKGVDDDISF